MDWGTLDGDHAVKGAVTTRLLQLALILTLALPFLFLAWSRTSYQPARTIPAHPEPPVQGLIDQKDTEHRNKVLARALKENPGHVPVLLPLAKLQSEQGDFPDAIRRLQEILDREPDNTEAMLELGKMRYQQGDIRNALDQTLDILKKHPSHPDALYNLGAIYGNLGDQERAAEYWRRLVKSDPNSESGKLAQQMLPLLEARGR
jgi:tetratricopeptide (TPR) repeat protein